MFDTKIAIIVRDKLEPWQRLNVTAFMVSGVIGSSADIIGEPYTDREGNIFNPLCIQPMIVLTADADTLRKIHQRALERGVRTSAYVEEMFSTSHDAENRSVFSRFGPDNANLVGLSLRAEKKLVDKITKGAKMHA